MRFGSSPEEVVVGGAHLQWGAVDGNVAEMVSESKCRDKAGCGK